jgi:hypothetical protein
LQFRPRALAAREEGDIVRFINMYLIGYVVLVIGVVLGLWRAGVLDRVAPAWIGIGLVS